MVYRKEIKVTKDKGKTLVRPSIKDGISKKIVFSFSFFKGNSIVLHEYNSYYENRNDAEKAVSDFFQTVSEISKLDSTTFYSVNMQKQFHYNKFKEKREIERIENVLIKGYSMPKEKVDEFERLFFEFSFGNGKRAICTMIYDNIFEVLFIDCNHMICLESCRDVNKKTLFGIPSLFVWDEKKSKAKDDEKIELINMLMEDAKNNKYHSVDDLIKDYEELLK